VFVERRRKGWKGERVDDGEGNLKSGRVWRLMQTQESRPPRGSH
jgi:hypothetical protein